MNMYKTAGQMT